MVTRALRICFVIAATGNANNDHLLQLEHFLIRSFIVFPILSSLHFLCTSPERDIRIVNGCSRSILRFYRQYQRLLCVETLIQPVIVDGYADLIVLLEQRFRLIQRNNGLARALLQTIHHFFEFERSDLEATCLCIYPFFIRTIHIIVGYILFDTQCFTNENENETRRSFIHN